MPEHSQAINDSGAIAQGEGNIAAGERGVAAAAITNSRVSTGDCTTNITNKYYSQQLLLQRQMDAYQQACALSIKLRHHVYRETILDVVIECQDWLNNNYIYLAPEASSAFQKAYNAAAIHAEFVRAQIDDHTRRENWNDIVQACEIIKHVMSEIEGSHS